MKNYVKTTFFVSSISVVSHPRLCRVKAHLVSFWHQNDDDVSQDLLDFAFVSEISSGSFWFEARLGV